MWIRCDLFIWPHVSRPKRSRLDRRVHQSPGRVSVMDRWTFTGHSHGLIIIICWDLTLLLHNYSLFLTNIEALQTYLTVWTVFMNKNTSIINTNVWSRARCVTSCSWEHLIRVIIVAQMYSSHFILLSCKLPEEKHLRLLVWIALIHLSLQTSIYSKERLNLGYWDAVVSSAVVPRGASSHLKLQKN